ncbi:ribosomal protein L7/L12 [Paenibacillus peoriae]|uniref:ribosomal protein L7/L12 n=1 Tax=Paenibacillus peoriae TaxID=59893 RepID=UPI00026C5D27|nr:ribosomal protein L7/L12 [Paenibacillus peoriae]MEC0182857.1 ribosomal protein L7/L12 [Paenibacillus peoriae]
MSAIEYIAIIALLLSVILLIKVYSLQSRLHDLKSDVERLENRSGIPGTLSGPIPTAPPHYPDTETSGDINERLLMLIREGKKIQAIKELRIARDLSLKEAKDYVDALERL